jgi:hypothetical protein
MITGIANQSVESTQRAVEFISQGKAFKHLKKLPPSDIYFITACDKVLLTLRSLLVVSREHTVE